jgi:phosphohistidine phosphatase SixA
VLSVEDDANDGDAGKPFDNTTGLGSAPTVPGSIPGDTGEPNPSEPVTIYAVRHAEKGSGTDPGLTEEGQARAEALAVLLHEVPLVAVYATEKLRTQETVAPTADDHGLEIIVDIDPEDELAAWVVVEHAGEEILHAGHSYTLPDFMEALGIEEVPSMSYGALWIITAWADGEVSLEETTFGE